MKSRYSGFTLIELMIVVAVVGILAMVALPSYRNHVIKSNRSAAQAEMMNISNHEEQYLLANREYATKAQLGYTLTNEVSSNYDYDITVGGGTIPSYTITFTAQGGQVNDGDLTLNSEGVKTPEEKWQR